MLTASDVRNVSFSKAMGGYKPDEVDVFLEDVENDYLQYEREIKEYKSLIEKLNKEIEDYKASQDSIHNVLLNAQKLADQIIKEAKEKSDEIVNSAESSISAITEHEKELSAAFELKAKERKSALEKELNAMIKAAQNKAEVITKAAEETVAKQQVIFDRLKLETIGFKASITEKYEEHIELLKAIPVELPNDPQAIAKAAALAYENNPEEFAEVNKNISSKTDSDGFKVDEDENNP